MAAETTVIYDLEGLFALGHLAYNFSPKNLAEEARVNPTNILLKGTGHQHIFQAHLTVSSSYFYLGIQG